MAKKKTTESGEKRTKKKAVEFRCHAPDARAVFLAGSFNDWDMEKTPMKREKDGQWCVTLRLPKGGHEYRFVADGHWFSDHQADESAPNPHGSTNSVLVV